MEKYNGWTNYATWRINLELLDGFNLCDLFYDVGTDTTDAYDVGQELKAYVEGMIENDPASEFVKGYAFAFLADVNWQEIATALLEAEKESEVA